MMEIIAESGPGGYSLFDDFAANDTSSEVYSSYMDCTPQLRLRPV
jgi:hypothetical protein